MPKTERMNCPSCGGTEYGSIEHRGKLYRVCTTPRTKTNGLHGRRRREWVAPCGFWSTKESAWLRKTSS